MQVRASGARLGFWNGRPRIPPALLLPVRSGKIASGPPPRLPGGPFRRSSSMPSWPPTSLQRLHAAHSAPLLNTTDRPGMERTAQAAGHHPHRRRTGGAERRPPGTSSTRGRYVPVAFGTGRPAFRQLPGIGVYQGRSWKPGEVANFPPWDLEGLSPDQISGSGAMRPSECAPSHKGSFVHWTLTSGWNHGAALSSTERTSRWCGCFALRSGSPPRYDK